MLHELVAMAEPETFPFKSTNREATSAEALINFTSQI